MGTINLWTILHVRGLVRSLQLNWSLVWQNILQYAIQEWNLRVLSAQKMTLSIKEYFSKFDQNRRKLRIWSHVLKKSLMKNFIFCAVSILDTHFVSSASTFLTIPYSLCGRKTLKQRFTDGSKNRCSKELRQTLTRNRPQSFFLYALNGSANLNTEQRSLKFSNMLCWAVNEHT